MVSLSSSILPLNYLSKKKNSNKINASTQLKNGLDPSGSQSINSITEGKPLTDLFFKSISAPKNGFNKNNPGSLHFSQLDN